MQILVKKINNWAGSPIQVEAPESVELYLNDELIVEDGPGPEIDARIEGILIGFDFLGQDYDFEVEDNYD